MFTVYSASRLHWKTAASIIKKSVGSLIEVNETPIENHKKGYYELYVNGNRDEVIHVFFRGNTISSFGYKNVTYNNTVRNTEHCYIRGEKKEIRDFLNYVLNILTMKGNNRHEMEEELYEILSKKA